MRQRKSEERQKLLPNLTYLTTVRPIVPHNGESLEMACRCGSLIPSSARQKRPLTSRPCARHATPTNIPGCELVFLKRLQYSNCAHSVHTGHRHTDRRTSRYRVSGTSLLADIETARYQYVTCSLSLSSAVTYPLFLSPFPAHSFLACAPPPFPSPTELSLSQPYSLRL